MAIILTGSTGVATPAVVDASGGNTATINSMTPTADSLQGFRNRIINGDMRIDQRNAGASVTPSTVGSHQYLLDRWFVLNTPGSKYSVQQNAGSVTPPTGFSNYLGCTSVSAYSIGSSEYQFVGQKIEGFNFADLMWGTANAKTVTLSFWVRSSLTGTFGGFLRNNANNRFYPFSYTINAANTWEYETITIAGDTTGTWVGATNGTGLDLNFSIATGSNFTGTAGAWTASAILAPTGQVSVVGTNGATWYITGVQLEVGSVATPFERRPYGTELQLCQRYYEQANMAVYSTVTRNSYSYHVPKRAYPSSVTLTTGTIINYYEDFASFSNGADAATTMKINAEL